MRHCKKPIVYDEKLHKDVLSKISLVIVIHLMFGIYAYGCPAIFPTEVGMFVIDQFTEKASLSQNYNSMIWEVFRRVPYFLQS